MAEAVGNPTGDTSRPVTLGLPNGNQSQQPQPSQQQTPGQFNPDSLPAEARTVYDNFQRERSEWDTQRKTWESERTKYSDMEKKFQNLEKQLEQYAATARTWEPWLPIINGLNKPGVIEQAIALSRGETLRPPAEPTQQTAQQTLTRFLQGVGDDDVVTGAMVNQALSQLRDELKASVLKDAEQGWTKYGEQAGDQIMRQLLNINNEYYGMADQLLNLKLQKLYDLKPKEGALYDEQKIINEARRLNNRDLMLAYTMLYGDEQTKQAIAASTQQSEAEYKKAIDDAYQRGIKEGQLNQHNQQNPLISPMSSATLPKFTVSKPGTYASAEAALAEKLNGIGVRG